MVKDIEATEPAPKRFQQLPSSGCSYLLHRKLHPATLTAPQTHPACRPPFTSCQTPLSKPEQIGGWVGLYRSCTGARPKAGQGCWLNRTACIFTP